MKLTQLQGFCTGITFTGFRQPDSTLHSINGDILPDWPEEIILGSISYSLKRVVNDFGNIEEAFYD